MLQCRTYYYCCCEEWMLTCRKCRNLPGAEHQTLARKLIPQKNQTTNPAQMKDETSVETAMKLKPAV